MSTLTSSFSEVSFSTPILNDFHQWFLIFMFLDITDMRKEKRLEEKKHRVFQEEFQKTSVLHKIREIKRMAMSL